MDVYNIMIILTLLLLIGIIITVTVSDLSRIRKTRDVNKEVEEEKKNTSEEEEEEEEEASKPDKVDEIVEPDETFDETYSYHNHAPQGHNWKNDHKHFFKNGRRYYTHNGHEHRSGITHSYHSHEDGDGHWWKPNRYYKNWHNHRRWRNDHVHHSWDNQKYPKLHKHVGNIIVYKSESKLLDEAREYGLDKENSNYDCRIMCEICRRRGYEGCDKKNGICSRCYNYYYES